MVKAIDEAEKTGNFDAPEYKGASQEFYHRHVCRLDPMPKPVADSFGQMEEDPTVYEACKPASLFGIKLT